VLSKPAPSKGDMGFGRCPAEEKVLMKLDAAVEDRGLDGRFDSRNADVPSRGDSGRSPVPYIPSAIQ